MWIQPVLSEAMLAVGEFHTAFSLPLHLLPQQHIPAELAQLRVALLEEEVAEFRTAARDDDLVAIADALGDIAYVLYGTALTYGIDLDAVIAEVHRSNMSKLGPDGVPILREDGKVLKPPSFTRPDLGTVLASQVPLPFQPHNEGRTNR
jgi:predicted HAD superfamily Cof-like phosphohydrolase